VKVAIAIIVATGVNHIAGPAAIAAVVVVA